jgi:hypothetical protein
VGAVDEELERFWFSMPDMSGHVRRPAVLITIGIDGGACSRAIWRTGTALRLEDFLSAPDGCIRPAEELRVRNADEEK